MDEGKYVTLELCKERREEKEKRLVELEKRLIEIFKKYTALSDMADEGHREALKSAMNNVQKSLDLGEARFTRIEEEDKKILDKFSTIDSGLKVIKESDIATLRLDLDNYKKSVDKKFSYFYKVTGGIVLVFVVALMNEGNWEKTFKSLFQMLETIIKIFI